MVAKPEAMEKLRSVFRETNLHPEGVTMRYSIISTLIFLMFPAFLWAEVPSSTISGTIGELEVNVPIWADQSDFYGEGNGGGVSILTRPVAPDNGLGTVSIGFEGSDFSGGNFTNFEINIADIAAGNMSGYYSDLDHDIQIAITKAEIRDGLMSIAGTIQGMLIWRQLMPISERKEDPTRLLPVDLTFHAVLENEY